MKIIVCFFAAPAQNLGFKIHVQSQGMHKSLRLGYMFISRFFGSDVPFIYIFLLSVCPVI